MAFALLAAALLILVPSMPAAAAGAAPITLSFDHLSTGFELDGVHRDPAAPQGTGHWLEVHRVAARIGEAHQGTGLSTI